jgi:hypothetical protein
MLKRIKLEEMQTITILLFSKGLRRIKAPANQQVCWERFYKAGHSRPAYVNARMTAWLAGQWAQMLSV